MREDGSSSGYLFPIGLGLGALMAIALFSGLDIGPFATSRDTADTTVASDELPVARAERDAVPTVSLDASRTPPPEAAAAVSAGDGDVAGTSGSPSVDDPEAANLFGGRVAMVSSAAPRVIVLADGTNLVPGERLPGGDRIIGIERDRILLERNGAEWQVRVP